MRKQIFLDCDGVLADFNRGAEKILGLPPGAFEERHGARELWRRLARADGFFDSLEPMPDAFELYEAVRRKSPIILTGLPLGRWAEPQKRRWAERRFPGVPVITTLAALKHEHRHPGDVLVDDRDKHRRLWEANGGVFVHHKSAADSIAQLRQLGYLD
jgi:hypothetical protein